MCVAQARGNDPFGIGKSFAQESPQNLDDVESLQHYLHQSSATQQLSNESSPHTGAVQNCGFKPSSQVVLNQNPKIGEHLQEAIASEGSL